MKRLLLLLAVAALFASCTASRSTSCPQAYGYKGHVNNEPFFPH